MKKSIVFFFFLFSFISSHGQNQSIKLWKDVVLMKKEKSCLYVFEPADSLRNGVSVIVCPGGSYSHLYGIKWEGFEVAQWLNERGITAFVLKYRVGKDGYHHPAMIEDVQRAIQWVKENADEYKLNTDAVGVMGFSAGGHLSLMAGAFHKENYLEKLGISVSVDLKPAFVVPVYPVVSMQDDIAHFRSRKNLLGKNFDKEKKDKFSMEKQLSIDMPPVFLTTTKDDPVVDYRNSTTLAEILLLENIPHEFQLFETGGHGYGMNEKRGGEAARWNIFFINWLREIGILN